ncbi:hypothetical protein OGAPHI_005323 [Ogataea philodendri]|uniref:Uncharacterized protein n=1 Tax=Ogataea philodendri TaxID=1378263 RepID=A0A9P8T201_9ASCO|nr:uncharacterized protein OGAPHI_005323 [Ogataea philodendri]KAH3663333.1 hypothetical protein OGAPHI_005323 [Ogataea philodendri]
MLNTPLSIFSSIESGGVSPTKLMTSCSLNFEPKVEYVNTSKFSSLSTVAAFVKISTLSFSFLASFSSTIDSTVLKYSSKLKLLDE